MVLEEEASCPVLRLRTWRMSLGAAVSRGDLGAPGNSRGTWVSPCVLRFNCDRFRLRDTLQGSHRGFLAPSQG